MDKQYAWAPSDRMIRTAIKAAARHGLQGEPDVLHDPQVPDAISATAIRAQETMQDLHAERARICRDDVSLVLTHMHVMYEDPPSGPEGRPASEAEERSARERSDHLGLRMEVRKAAARVFSAEVDHASDLQKVAHYYNQLIKKQAAAWKSHHPHRHHLGSVEIPVVEVPSEVLEFGQAALIRAVSGRGANELSWLVPDLDGQVPSDLSGGPDAVTQHDAANSTTVRLPGFSSSGRKS